MLADQPDPYARLRTFAEVYLDHHIDAGSGLGMVATEFGGLPPDLRRSIVALNDAQIKSRLMDILSDGVARGAFRPVNVSLCAQAIHGLLVTFIRAHESSRERVARDAMLEQVLEYYGAGLLPGARGLLHASVIPASAE